MGERDVGQRIDGADVWSQLSALYQCALLIELATVLPSEHKVMTRVLAPSLNQVLWLCNVHDADHAAKLREHVRAARKGVAADGVEHDIDSAPSGFTHDGVDIIFFFVVDGHIGPQAAGELKICLAHGGEYLRADCFRQLDRHMADAARAAVDKDAFADPEPGAHDQRFKMCGWPSA